MATVHKKHATAKKVTPEKEPQTPDVAQPETPQPAKVAEPVSEPPVNPQAPSAESETPIVPVTEDPLTDFKEKMSEEEQTPLAPASKKNYMWPILFIFIIAVALMIGIFIYKNGFNKSENINVVSLSPTPTTIPTPTITVDLSKYEIKILNGSEVDGEAGKQQASLEKEGFTISSIGNADKSDYTKTIIQAKKDVEKTYLDKLKSVLESSFVLGDQEELDDDADSDVIVIIGSETN